MKYQPARASLNSSGLWQSGGGVRVSNKTKRKPAPAPVRADERQLEDEAAKRAADPNRGKVHATTLSAPFGASRRRINSKGITYTGGRNGDSTNRRLIQKKRPKWKHPVTGRENIPSAVRTAVMDRDGEQCRYCGTSNGPWHLDHVQPVSKDGPTTIGNLVVACQDCNLRKGASVWVPNPVIDSS